MIRPYLTVIKDSFHEAFASRVLWIVLVVLTLLLLAMAPAGLRQQRASKLYLDGVNDWPGLVAKIKRQADAPAPSPGKRIWQLSSEKFRQTVTDALAAEDSTDISRDAASTLLDELNSLMRRRDFYDVDAWSDVKLDAEASKLLDRGVDKLPEDDLLFFNRQAFKDAFPAEVAKMPADELYLSYFGWAVHSPIPVSRDVAEPVIKLVLGYIMAFFVGIVAVFIAILVTAPIIPHMFDAGAIDLLLSKPVARSLLFLAKFVGGCAFILLCGGYFIVGLWLLMGLRFGLWDHSILCRIPIFLFMFSIYYSVSAFAAVRWKNAIVSVVIAILFWAFCFGLGVARSWVDAFYLRPNRIVSVVATGDSVAALNQAGEVLEWRDGGWGALVGAAADEGPRPGIHRVPVGPVFNLSPKELLLIRQPFMAQFSFMSPRPRLMRLAWAGGAWRQETGPAPPHGASWLFRSPQGEILVVAPSGVYRFDEKASESSERPAATAEKPQASQDATRTIDAGAVRVSVKGSDRATKKGPSGSAKPQTSRATKKRPELDAVSKIFKMFRPGKADPYVRVGPEPSVTLTSPFSAAMDPASGDMVVYRAGTLTCLRRNAKGKYDRAQHRKVTDVRGPASLAMAGGTVVVAQFDGKVVILDASNLKTRRQFQPAGDGEPYTVLAAKDGRRFALLTHGGALVVFDANGDNSTTVDTDVSGVGLDAEGRLLAADRGTRLTTYGFDSLAVVDRRLPRLDVLEAAYRYVLLPTYTIFPRPGELDNALEYLLSGEKSVTQGKSQDADVRQTRINVDVYGPIASSFAFVVVMLAVTCVYIHRMDF